jgi:uncharacterized protein (TIGR00299 family) protein
MQRQKQRIAYFDCYSGISGDMILGALVDLGLKLDSIRKGLKALDLKGYKISSKAVKRGGISGTKVTVTVDKPKKGHHHGRHFSDIKKLITKSKLSQQVKTSSIEVFHRIAKAEASVHRSSIEKVHFHEVGAVDSIVDIVGGTIGLELLGIDTVISSPLNLGEGTVECDHGVLPVPAPATLKLLKGIPCYSSGVQRELTTPTGAAMIGYLAKEFDSMPEMTIIDSGYGAGDNLIESPPNILRIIIGESVAQDSNSLMVVESNIDDMNPEFYDHVMESLFKAGAVDVYFTPIQMKKNRPAVKLSVLVDEAKGEEIARLLFSETSTFGLRYFPVDRMTLDREIKKIKTPYGEVKIKVGRWDGKVVQVSPEYEDCKKISRREKIPIKKIYEELLVLAKKIKISFQA